MTMQQVDFGYGWGDSEYACDGSGWRDGWGSG